MAEKDAKTKLRDYIRFCVESVSSCHIISQYLEYLAAVFCLHHIHVCSLSQVGGGKMRMRGCSNVGQVHCCVLDNNL